MAEFDELAENWDNNPQKIERARRVAEGIRRRISLNNDMSAMEFGCGTGQLSFCLHKELGPITLVDTSQGMLDVLRRKIKAADISNMAPVCVDLTAEESADTRFDLIYTLMALHHVQDLDRTLKAFQMHLHQGGFLCAADLDKEDGSFHGDGFEGHHGFDRDAFADQLAMYGFGDILFDDCFTLQREINGMDRSYNIFLMTCRKI